MYPLAPITAASRTGNEVPEGILDTTVDIWIHLREHAEK